MEDSKEYLERTIDELSEQLAGSIFQTIQLLSSIVSLLEKYYEGSHSRFVSEKAAEVAEAIGMDETEVFEVRIAGLLHDIGKVGFKDSLLFKYPSEMSQLDLKQYMMHPELGMKILGKHRGFETIGELIYQHHERIDGSGFPRHLQFNGIHPGASIIAVVDTYHNLVYRTQKDQSNGTAGSIKYSSATAFMDSTKDRFASAMNYLHAKKGILFEKIIVEKFSEIMQLERSGMGKKTVMRVLVGKLEGGMIFAESLFTPYGLLIAAKGEKLRPEMVKHLVRLSETGDIPQKLLVMK